MKQRTETLVAIRQHEFDVCVIGGGATGLGAALDLALRGKSVVLLDSADFVSQTSSASTKLVHGGVRYLQQAVASLDYGQFQMVRKALHERIHMLKAAPYLARPLELLVPCFSRWQMFYFAVGMKMYDMIAGRAHLEPSRILSRQQAALALPSLRMDRVAGAVTYFDGQFDDAGYGLAMARSISAAGGQLLNYARVVGFERDARGQLASVTVADRIGGDTFTVRARVFMNCTGPFADEVRLLANPSIARRLRLSKGIHILLPIDALQSSTALLIPSTEDGRVIFAIPWFGSLLVGTTEDEIEHGQPLAANQQEISYLLRYVNRYLRTDFTPADVQAAFAGVRPLVASRGSVDTKKLVRDHEVEVDSASGLISILGGKWTTYRAMAEDGVDHAMCALGEPGMPSVTGQHPLSGTAGFHADYWQQLVQSHGLSEAAARHLAQKYGTDAAHVLALADDQPELLAPLYPGAQVLVAEALYAICQQMAETIEDVLARRIGIEFHSWQSAALAAPAVGRLLGQQKGWSSAAVDQAVAEYLDKLARHIHTAGLPIEINPAR